jgi:hypothetical protein
MLDEFDVTGGGESDQDDRPAGKDQRAKAISYLQRVIRQYSNEQPIRVQFENFPNKVLKR